MPGTMTAPPVAADRVLRPRSPVDVWESSRVLSGVDVAWCPSTSEASICSRTAPSLGTGNGAPAGSLNY